MRATLYATIWASMTALAASEWARRRRVTFGPLSPLALSSAGLAALVVHIGIAILHHHGGRHAEAVEATARLTEQVYGIRWGGGVYVNYAFVAAWAAYLWWWRAHVNAPIASRHPGVLVARAVLFLIIVNALVIFASPVTRPLGVALSIALLWAWWPTPAHRDI